MQLKGRIKEDCVSLELSVKGSSPIKKIEKDTVVDLIKFVSKDDGTWYYIPDSGWIRSDSVYIIRDIGFLPKAKKNKLLTKRRTLLGDNSIDYGKITGAAITHPGGCFGIDTGENSIGPFDIGITKDNTIGEVADAFGISHGGLIGGALSDISMGALSDGSFLGEFAENLIDGALESIFDKIDNWIDSLFNTFFDRLSFVVGFDVEGFLMKYQSDFKLLVDRMDREDIGKYGNGKYSKDKYGKDIFGDDKYGKSKYNAGIISTSDEGWIRSYEAAIHYFDYIGYNREYGKVKKNVSKFKRSYQNVEGGEVIKRATVYYTDSDDKRLNFRTPLLVDPTEKVQGTDLRTGQTHTFYRTKPPKRDFRAPFLIEDPAEEVQGTDLRTGQTHTFYRTPVSSEVEFNRELGNAVYDEFTEAMSVIKKNNNLNIDKIDWFSNFNRFRTTHPDYHLTGSLGHVFITRPDLNIFGEDANTLNPDIAKSDDNAFFAQLIKRNSPIARSLTKHLSGSHDLIPLIHNTARSIDIQDTSIDTLEHGETLTKWKLVYGKDMIKSITSGTFSISYIDDSKLSISLMHLAWINYINGLTRGLYPPKRNYIREKILDYASSCYYILTDITGENIIFWSKFWGVFPTNYPSSSFSMSESGSVKVPSINVQYAYSFRKDMDPLILAEFNRNSSCNNTWNYIPTYDPKLEKKGKIKPINDNITLHTLPTIVGPPFIDTVDGGFTYKLRWRKIEDGENNRIYAFNSKGVTQSINILPNAGNNFDKYLVKV